MMPASSRGGIPAAEFHTAGWMWLVLAVILVGLILADLMLHRREHEPTIRRTVIESSVWIAIGLGFGLLIWSIGGSGAAGEYYSGYLIEKSLSVDNVFVWSVVFASFGIAARYQRRILFWGIFGALVLRGIFVFAGIALIDAFSQALIVFGLVLLYSGVKVLRHRDDEGEPEHARSLGLVGRLLPVRNDYVGSRFTVLEQGRRYATPLLAALVVVEITDVIFAVDSVPAVLAVSAHPFIVLSSNAFAILGLRSLYFLLAGAKERFHYLSHALGAILIFVGAKMIVGQWWHMPTGLSLGVIAGLLAVGIVASESRARRHATLTSSRR